ncbi:MAG TPA: nucleotidyltransferase family protein [Edaphocola sp.]|nr:nucleotidyltransferase family protein [Edaphocola sp.]
MKAMILAAGLGTRLKPFTNHHPKALAKVNDKTLLEINIRKLQQLGINDIVVNVHHFADQIEDFLIKNDHFGSNIIISDERNQVLETGGGLKKAIPLLSNSEDILVMNVDILSDINLEQLINHHKRSGAIATLAVQNRNSSRAFLFADEDLEKRLIGWQNNNTKEQKIPCPNKNEWTTLAFSGIQILKSTFLSKIKQEGKFSLVDVYLSLCCEEKIFGYNHTGDKLLDVGKPESLEIAKQMFA